jgi:hypothetical protein
MVIFYAILNVAGINSLVLHCSNNPAVNIRKREFLQTLSHELIRPHLQERARVQQLPRCLRNRLQEICGNRENSHEIGGPAGNSDSVQIDRREQTGRCALCYLYLQKKLKNTFLLPKMQKIYVLGTPHSNL